MITVKLIETRTWKVFLEGKHIGEIRTVGASQYQYFPKGSKTGGDKFNTFQECRRSLEAE